MNEAMQKLIDAVQKASPVVWQAAYRQVWVDGAEYLALILAFVTGGRFLWRFAQHLEDERAEEIGVFFTRAGAVVLLAVTIPCFIGAADAFLNPTFAAIKNLKGLL